MNCSSQQVTLRRLNKAFQAFFARCRKGQAPGFPRFKSLARIPGFGYKGHGDGWRFSPGDGWKNGTLRLQGPGTSAPVARLARQAARSRAASSCFRALGRAITKITATRTRVAV